MSQPLHVLAGTDLVIDNESENVHSLPYEHVRMLGHGGNASVEMVRDTKTGAVYARKIIRNVYSRNVADAKTRFLNEVRIMQRLESNDHIVKVHATCIKNRELTLIMEPVANGGDLATFLQNYRDTGKSWFGGVANSVNRAHNEILWKAPGCLASALDFIHARAIRHKDIKPQNILIHQGKVLYTDFGLSYDSSAVGHSTTTGQPQGLSRRYCAPEVIEWDSRNSRSDIFSLGCVFLEILLAINHDAYWDRVYGGKFYETLRITPEIDPLNLSICTVYPFDVEMIQEMTVEDPALRPTAGQVFFELIHKALAFESDPWCCCTCLQIYYDMEGALERPM